MSGFHRSVTIGFLSACVAVAMLCGELHAQDKLNSAFAAGPNDSVQVTRTGVALKVNAHHATVAKVLSALASINIGYRSSIVLDEAVDGIYTGDDRQVVARILDGYNYAIKRDGTKLEVIVFGKRGDNAVPAAIVIPIRRRPSD